jgi:hypothetical protein
MTTAKAGLWLSAPRLIARKMFTLVGERNPLENNRADGIDLARYCAITLRSSSSSLLLWLSYNAV